jgi:hypothetical protein
MHDLCLLDPSFIDSSLCALQLDILSCTFPLKLNVSLVLWDAILLLVLLDNKYDGSNVYEQYNQPLCRNYKSLLRRTVTITIAVQL